MKDIDLFAIDRNWKSAGKTVGIKAPQVEKIGDFELVDPVSLGDKLFGSGYVKHRVVSVLFDDLDDLVGKIESFQGFVKTGGFKGAIEPGGIRLLVVVCHGRPGVLFIDGVDASGKATNYLSAATIAKYSRDLGRLGKYLAAAVGSKGSTQPFATIRFDGCNAGADSTDPHEARGSDLLVGLSHIWPGTRIVAFIDYGIGTGSQTAPFAFAGAEDSNVYFDDTKLEPVFGKWDIATHAWRSENSPNAKIAQDGVILCRPSHEILRTRRRDFERELATSPFNLYAKGAVTSCGIGQSYSDLPAPTGASVRPGTLYHPQKTSP